VIGTEKRWQNFVRVSVQTAYHAHHHSMMHTTLCCVRDVPYAATMNCRRPLVLDSLHCDIAVGHVLNPWTDPADAGLVNGLHRGLLNKNAINLAIRTHDP